MRADVEADRSKSVRVLAAGVVAAMLLTSGARAEPAALEAVLIVRVALVVDLSKAARQTVHQTIRRIFHEAGIEIVWRECLPRVTLVTTPSDPCEEPLARTEVVVRLISAPASTPSGALGFSYVEAGARISRLASVHPERVARLAHGTRLDPAVLLARVIAHEVGHLLLNTTEHSREGLMRSHWSNLDLNGATTHAWAFSLQQAASMRRSLLAEAAN